MSRRGSVSIVYDYRLDDLANGIQSFAEAKDFSSSLCILTSSGVHPGSYSMSVPGVLSKGAKRGLGATLITHAI
jgi:hypothetical protein